MFILPVVFLALLPFAVQTVASSVPLPYELTVPESPCKTEPDWIQPIAISLGLDSVIAAYAHSDTNISIIATIAGKDPDPNLKAYGRTVAHLRRKHITDYNNAPARVPKNWFTQAVDVVVNILTTVRHVAELLWTDVFLRMLDESKEIYVYPIWVSAHIVTYEYRQLARAMEYFAEKIDWTEKSETLDLDYVQDSFRQALNLIKDRAYTNTGINITAAMIMFPDSFPWDVQGRAEAAAYGAGMGTPSLPALTKRQVFERYANALLFNKTRTTAIARQLDHVDDQPSLILLEQGNWYFDLLTSGKHCMMQHPMDHMGCAYIILDLWVAFRERNADVAQEILAGQSWPVLRRELARARDVLKEYREREGEGEQVEEWPLDLDGWWSSKEKRRPVSLRWEDVHAVDEGCVQFLAETLDQVQLCLQGATRSSAPASSKSMIDGVAIMNSQCDDGAILKLAIKRSMGEHVHIFSSAGPGEEQTYMARLGARAALRIRQRVAEEMEVECLQAKYMYQDGYGRWYYRRRGEVGQSDALYPGEELPW